MQWIASAGGPLVLVPETMLHQWRGAVDGGGDYVSACTVDEYSGVIQWNGVDVLVLNDEPLATTCLANGLIVFLRWIYAPNEDAITCLLQDAMRNFPKNDLGPALNCQSGKYVLFDAGATGENVTEVLEVDVAPGRYIVETHVWKPNEDVGLVVHVLRP